MVRGGKSFPVAVEIKTRDGKTELAVIYAQESAHDVARATRGPLVSSAQLPASSRTYVGSSCLVA